MARCRTAGEEVKRRCLPFVFRLAAFLAALIAAPIAGDSHAQTDPAFEAFRRMATLGFEPVLTAVFARDSVLSMIDALPEGGALRLDLDGDGKIDALAWREGTTRVVGIDEDHDLGPDDTRTDRDNDCVAADVGDDGVPDRVVDRKDTNGDGIADLQVVYEITTGALGARGVGVLAFFDLDRDGRMLHLTDYGYHANRDMWESDFAGNTCFLAGIRDEATGRWTSVYENPFCFYDDDGDGSTDEALRLEGENLRIKSLRWSFDADGDGAERPDYDFSLTALGPASAPPSLADSLLLRDGRTLHFVAWDRARDFARWALWRSILLVWDEDDANVAPHSEARDRERWEGVIADPYKGFPGVGGPDCGRINKRYELDRDGSGRLGVYFSSVDDRIHLRGAEEGEIRIVLPAERPIDRNVAMLDADGDGYFDSWSYSGGPHDRSIRLRDEEAQPLRLDLAPLRAFWRKALGAARDRARQDTDQIERAIPMRDPNAVRSWWNDARDHHDPFVIRAGKSVETERYLSDVLLWEAGGGFLALDPDAPPRDDALPPWRAATTRVDPYFGRGVAFESPTIAYRTYDGRLDVFTKNRRQLVLRGDLGDYHLPQPWGMDALDVGDGPGLGGLYISQDGTWTPAFGKGSALDQPVITEEPDRVTVEVVLRAGTASTRRRWSITGDGPVIEEALAVTETVGGFAVAIPNLETSGVSADSSMIWSYGISVPGSRAIGLAGKVDGAHARFEVVQGNPAICMRPAPGDVVHLRWVAGGAVYGDSTAAAWAVRAAALLGVKR
jgi:hypothetical protein